MQLKQLKLAGFKSFVDATIIPFPSRLVAVVGPNGCGKSNIIDAVRWVLGERSAKNLRGESMTDVIFNGSSGRKSVGQASVELVFDNSLGRLTGPYATYQEVAIKRVVNRAGESFYYLNGSRCRRRDIHDLFLGTGANARGYAIIGQDMISQLVEARPEELRSVLEEAAGISKYKERRRDTLQHMTHTKENLSRLSDIREELNKQLIKLGRQAKTAQHFKSLKEKERVLQCYKLALKWQEIKQEQEQTASLLKKREERFAEIVASLKEQEQQRASLLENIRSGEAEFQQAQASLYQLGKDIIRLEEARHQRQLHIHQLQEDLDAAQIAYQSTHAKHKENSALEQKAQSVLTALKNQLQLLEHTSLQAEQQWKQWQTKEAQWHDAWQQLQGHLSQAQQTLKLADMQLEHIDQKRQDVLLRMKENQCQQEALEETAVVEKALDLLVLAQENVAKEIYRLEETKKALQADKMAKRAQLNELTSHLLEEERMVRRLSAEYAAAKAAMDSALSPADASLCSAHWQDKKRLTEALIVEKEWAKACQLVLGSMLQAFVVDAIERELPYFIDKVLDEELVSMTPKKASAGAPYPRLIDYIASPIPACYQALEDIFAAQTLQQALSWHDRLSAHQSIVTADGYWLGHGWIKTAHVGKNQAIGLLEQKHQVAKLFEVLQKTQARLKQLEENKEQQLQQVVLIEQQLDQLQQALGEIYSKQRTIENEIMTKRHKIQQVIGQKSSLKETSVQLQCLLNDVLSEAVAHEKKQKEAALAYQHYYSQQSVLTEEKNCWQSQLTASKEAAAQAKDAWQKAKAAYNEAVSDYHQKQEASKRDAEHQKLLLERLNTVQTRKEQLIVAQDESEPCLLEKQKKYQQEEAAVGTLAEQNDARKKAGHVIEQTLKSLTEQSNQELTKKQTLLLQEQALEMNLMSFEKALKELSTKPGEVLSALPSQISLEQIEQKLDVITRRIKQLGAINLVAIEEYAEENKRKRQIEEQYQDLQEALAKLEEAITTMDNETRVRLHDTFVALNERFSLLFPKLFGGGHAQLKLTCDNLLEAGILIMAQPPGKRNASIHLLSGGEKAMTALTLVFAIFQLNPAPFCMLDEVDASLDEENVARFSKLVTDMSAFVQFLFITHNKNTMEAAEHLIGVTMREPGVSRVVAVDMQEALAFTARQ